MKSSINNRFKQECKIIKLANEYRGYKGDIPYAVITDLTEEELNQNSEKLYSKTLVTAKSYIFTKTLLKNRA